MKKLMLALGLLVSCAAMAAGPSAGHKHAIARGKFLIGFGGCNDCHTPGWAENGGTAPKDKVLTGSGFNFQGPWGTTYPVNLRLYFQKVSLKQWIHDARSVKARPAMPWWNFRYLTDSDLADMYAYMRSLGPAGKPAHDWVPPGQDAPAPYLKLVVPPPPDVLPPHH
jgi:mono/diheme cytochrome c family protein